MERLLSNDEWVLALDNVSLVEQIWLICALSVDVTNNVSLNSVARSTSVIAVIEALIVPVASPSAGG